MIKKITFKEFGSDRGAIINVKSHKLSAMQPNDCNELWDGLSRWKANVGSASWRNFRQSRRMVLRSKSKRQLPSDHVATTNKKETTNNNKIFLRSQRLLIDLGEDDDESTATETTCSTENPKREKLIKKKLNIDHFPETMNEEDPASQKNDICHDRRIRKKDDSSESNDDSNKKVQDGIHNEKQSLKIEGEPSDKDTSPSIDHSDSISNISQYDDPEESRQRAYDAIIAEIKLLERYLNEQEDEITDFEAELEKSYEENEELSGELEKKRQRFHRLEDKYLEFKTVLADARADEDDLNFEFVKTTSSRNIESLNLNNDIDQMRLRVKKMEQENKYYLKQLEKAERTTQQKERRLSSTFSEIDLWKKGAVRKRRQRVKEERDTSIHRQKQLEILDKKIDDGEEIDIFLHLNNDDDDELSILSNFTFDVSECSELIQCTNNLEMMK